MEQRQPDPLRRYPANLPHLARALLRGRRAAGHGAAARARLRRRRQRLGARGPRERIRSRRRQVLHPQPGGPVPDERVDQVRQRVPRAVARRAGVAGAGDGGVRAGAGAAGAGELVGGAAGAGGGEGGGDVTGGWKPARWRKVGVGGRGDALPLRAIANGFHL